MKLTDWIVDKFGPDKVMHYLVAAWISAALSPKGFFWLLAGGFSVIVLNIVKERFFDGDFEVKDVYSASFGTLTSAIIYGLLALI